MTGFTETNTIQMGVVDRLSRPDLGWRHVRGSNLTRTTDSVFLERELLEAMTRLNPLIARDPERVNEVVPQLRAALLSATIDGLVPSNEWMVKWLRGAHTHKFVGTDTYEPIQLIDFESPRSNSLIVSDEVTFYGGGDQRFDIVLWVNGIPLVVGETKTPGSMQVSWLDAAKDITETYEVETPQFFVPNVLSFGTDGRELRYGAVAQPPELWLPWGATTDPLDLPPMKRTMRSVELLLSPEQILDILRDFTLYTSLAVGPQTIPIKVIPRYPQVEGVQAILARALDPLRRQGLIWHHQGSGKTFLAAFAAVKLLRELRLDGPTVLVVLDRLDLIEQTTREFLSAGVPRVRVAETKDELRRLLAEDARGVIITTIFRFEAASRLNERSNIIVLVDEAHRTQEGRLGQDMRAALPNAQFFGLTGTPISDPDRNTFALFGDSGDPGHVLNSYSVERSIADGATLPVHVETRLVNFHIDKDGLDEAYVEMADEEGLTDDERDVLARRASRVDTFMKNPERVRAVCEDVVDHWYGKLAPLGLKAQVVAFDRQLCVAYLEEIKRLLEERAALEPGSRPFEACIVMTVGSIKGEPEAWQQYALTRDQEAKLKARFRDVHDPLVFLVVTAKLLTGFDAPIEGVLYLDKPLRAHTLFQAITRTNRRWTNPITGQEKRYGLIVDYVGIGAEIGRSLQTGDPNREGKRPVDVDELYAELGAALADAQRPFEGLDRSRSAFEILLEAQQRIHGPGPSGAFAENFLRCEALWEFLWPDVELRRFEDEYRWLAKVYASVQPATASNALLWRRLGAKTLELIHGSISEVRVDQSGLEEVVVDEEVIAAMRQLGLEFEDTKAPPTVGEVLDSIESRLRRKLAGPTPHSAYESLAKRLEKLRQMKVAQATGSMEFLKQLLEIARQVLAVEKAEADGRLDEMRSILPDPDIGALTQIFREYKPDAAPEIIERVVLDIDTIVRQVRFTGWQTSHPGDRQVRQEVRLVLRKYGLPPTGELFDRAYAYIVENY